MTRSSKFEIFLSIVGILIITIVGIILLAAERAEQNVVMVPETEYIENPISEQSAENIKININTAPKEELVFLDGIGEQRAEAIITYRENSPFKTKEEIMKVSGISQVTFDKIADNIYVE